MHPASLLQTQLQSGGKQPLPTGYLMMAKTPMIKALPTQPLCPFTFHEHHGPKYCMCCSLLPIVHTKVSYKRNVSTLNMGKKNKCEFW